MNRKQAALAGLVVAVLSISLVACGSSGSDATAGGGNEPTTIRYQSEAGTISPLEIADALGYLGNLKLESIGTVLGGPESVQALATNQTDVSAGCFNGSIIKAIAAGAPIKAVVGMYGSDEQSFQGLYVLDDSSIHNAHDLIGKKIGVNTLGANFEAWVDLWLKEEGLTPDEIEQVEFVVIPALNAEQALREKQLDAVVLIGSLRELAESKGGVRTVAKDIEVLGNYTGNSISLRTDYIKEHPKTSAQLVGGIAKAVKYLQTTPPAQVIKLADKVAAEHGRPEDKESLKFWKSLGVVNPGGVISPKEFSTWITLLEENGELGKGEIQLSETYTNELNPFAKSGGGSGA